MIDLRQHDATGWAALVRDGEVHPRQLVDAAIARIEESNPIINAFVHLQLERARAEAETINRAAPFAGVPFAFKDYQCREAGERYSAGMRVLRDMAFVPTTTSPLVVAFRRAGVIPLGRTNTSELALVGTTEPEAFGPTRNPWDHGRVPAGSSGGAAAAVADGMVCAAHGNDIAGSIRLPAAAAGLVGLKPTRGRCLVSTFDSPVGMFIDGVLTRSVRDTAGFVDVIRGTGGPWPAPPLPGPLAAEVGQPVPTLRIGVCTDAFTGIDTDHASRAAAESVATTLERAGHTVDPAYPTELAEARFWDAMRTALAANAAHVLAGWSTRIGRPLSRDDVEPGTWKIVSTGQTTSAIEVIDALATMHDTARRAERWWATYDLLITPTAAEPSLPIGDYLANQRAGRGSAYTRPFNATGQPAISLPAGRGDDGLPRGVQLVAGYGREDLLIRVASFLEAEHSWLDHRPPAATLPS